MHGSGVKALRGSGNRATEYLTNLQHYPSLTRWGIVEGYQTGQRLAHLCDRGVGTGGRAREPDREDRMSTRWMPWRCAPKKDVATLRKACGRRVQPMIARFPNGATPWPAGQDLRKQEGTGGTETSHVPRGSKRTPVVVASEPGQAQTSCVSSRQALRRWG